MPLKPLFTRKIIAWAFYDWANSAFFTVVMTFIFSAYFTSKVAADKITGTHQWADAIALSGLIIALSGPIFGAIADNAGFRKRWLGFFTLVAVVASACLWFSKPDLAYVNQTLFFVVLGTVGVEIGMVFYNAHLPTLAPEKYLGRISGLAWGLGYLGGLSALMVTLFGFIKGEPSWLNTTTFEQIRICGPFIALWLAVFSLPLFIIVPETAGDGLGLRHAIKKGLRQLVITLKTAQQHKNLFTFLLARMIYIDGLNTIFAFAGIYAVGTFGFTLSEVVVFGIVMNVAAALGAALFACLDDFIGPRKTVLISLVGLIILTTIILFVSNKALFWSFAVMLSLFVGPTQAASRSLMVRLISKDQCNEMFGLYAFSGKATSFLGPWFLGMITLAFDSQRAGMATVIVFFIVGAVLLNVVKEKR